MKNVIAMMVFLFSFSVNAEIVMQQDTTMDNYRGVDTGASIEARRATRAFNVIVTAYSVFNYRVVEVVKGHKTLGFSEEQAWAIASAIGQWGVNKVKPYINDIDSTYIATIETKNGRKFYSLIAISKISKYSDEVKTVNGNKVVRFSTLFNEMAEIANAEEFDMDNPMVASYVDKAEKQYWEEKRHW